MLKFPANTYLSRVCNVNALFFLKAAETKLPIDDTLKKKIGELVGSGIYHIKDVLHHLRVYAKETQPHVEETNSRFYPTIKTIGNHIQMHLRRLG